jgi:hypothetical protein
MFIGEAPSKGIDYEIHRAGDACQSEPIHILDIS